MTAGFAYPNSIGAPPSIGIKIPEGPYDSIVLHVAAQLLPGGGAPAVGAGRRSRPDLAPVASVRFRERGGADREGAR